MNGKRERLAAVIELRDAALALLEKHGVPDNDMEGGIWFERHTRKNPAPRVSLFLFNDYVTEAHALNVWGTLKGKQRRY